jgi:hypothetical protein
MKETFMDKGHSEQKVAPKKNQQGRRSDPNDQRDRRGTEGGEPSDRREDRARENEEEGDGSNRSQPRR